MTASGETHVYVLARAGFEDVCKVGMSHQPLVRWQSFHPRWFELFSLEQSQLLRFDSRREALACETRFHRALAEHGCPSPLEMPMVAGGHGEWYRGAAARIGALADACEHAGVPVTHDLVAWTAAQMQQAQGRLYELLATGSQGHWDGSLTPAARRAVLDLADAHAHFDPTVRERCAEWLEVLRG